jgi:hypothetical protein
VTWLLIIGALAALLFLIVAVVSRGAGGPSSTIGFPYVAAPSLFSAAERSFLGVLDQSLGNEYRAFGKVRVADVASLKPGMAQSARQGALNRISGKHFDFVVCRSSDLAIVCAIELNDKSHATQRAKKRDDFLIELCQHIGLPLIQVPAKATYQLDEVRQKVLSAIVPAANATQREAVLP